MVLPALPTSRVLQGSLVGNGRTIREAPSSSQPYKRQQISHQCRFLLCPVFLGMACKKITGLPWSPRELFCLLGKKMRDTNGSCVLSSFSVGFGYQVVSHLKMHLLSRGVTSSHSCNDLPLENFHFVIKAILIEGKNIFGVNIFQFLPGEMLLSWLRHNSNHQA